MALSLRPAAARLLLSSTRPSSAITRAATIIPQCRTAAFHVSRRSQILPVGPQVIHGGVNDPVPIPEPNAAHGSYHWAFERLISVGLVPLTVAPFVSGSGQPVLDAALASTLLLHSHIGFDACVVDYFPKHTYPKLAVSMKWLLRAATITAGVGLFSFQTNDVGITEAVRRVWTA